MSSDITSRRKSAPRPSATLFDWFARSASFTALLCLVAVFAQMFLRSTAFGQSGWPAALLVIATAFATLTSMARQLAGQNVMLAATIIAVAGGVAHAVGVITGIPFGPFAYLSGAGPMFFNTLAWPMPAVWIIVLLNARGVARLILKPWRKLKNYGFFVIGMAAALVVLFDLALEPFATRVNGYWVWLPTKFPWTWNGMPLINSLGWALVALITLAFATPAMINKHSRSRKLPPDFHPLIVWVLLLMLFGTGAAMNQLWSSLALCVATALTSTVFALRGAKW
jgi:uncharacterized membrane protein